VTGGWRKMHNEILNNMYISPNIIIIIKSRRMREVGLLVGMKITEIHAGVWLGNEKGREH
jgi:hypothetical protein